MTVLLCCLPCNVAVAKLSYKQMWLLYVNKSTQADKDLQALSLHLSIDFADRVRNMGLLVNEMQPWHCISSLCVCQHQGHMNGIGVKLSETCTA